VHRKRYPPGAAEDRTDVAPRIALVTALLPPTVGGTEILIWRLFRDHPGLIVVSGAPAPTSLPTTSSTDGYRALDATTLALPYPRLRGYRFGLAPALGIFAGVWLAKSLVRVVRFLKAERVEHVISVPHQGPFALLGLLAARRLRIRHTFYILDAWEEAATGPVERAMIEVGLRLASRTPNSRLAVVSPALGTHYLEAFGFRDPVWIPNPAPLSSELPVLSPTPKPFVLFTGGLKPVNFEAVRRLIEAMRRCRVAEKLVITGNNTYFADVLRSHGELHDRVAFINASRTEIARVQREAAVLVIASNVDDASATARGYLPGRLPEYVASRRPVLLIGPEDSEASRAVRHWNIGRTTSSQDVGKLAAILDELTEQSMAGRDAVRIAGHHQLFLEVFSPEEARRRLWGEPAPTLSRAAADLAESFALHHDDRR
jgi:hypothetical protein